ncbi:MAG: hypothetical protein II577_06415, partial [Erysipelotrichaceae bacterium]|nr:hypothetical protein [Erysipelotrichaceae bacterium]
TVIMHNDRIPEEILLRYAKEDSIEVVDHGDSGTKVLKYDLLTFDRDLVRHDPKKIAKALESIL